ncbi:MAG: RnfABCDGE type electron transport complex subunit G [Bacteroidales bacterium]|nr:RnfABCDGE type electron transport complex subunit G [Bacteroidales bacterium]
MAAKSTFTNMVLSLGSICLVCSALLGIANNVTAEPIAQATLAKINDKISYVVPSYDNNPSDNVTMVEVDGTEYKVYLASMSDKVVGYAIEVAPTGFGGPISMIVGFDAENGNIYNTAVISHSETPGLGDKIASNEQGSFRDQFIEMNPASNKLSVRKDGGDIDAITAATISSRAFTVGVSTAYKVYLTLVGSGDADVVSGASKK